MGLIPDINAAQALLEEYNEEAFHLYHAAVVSGVMGYFAKEYDPENEQFWRVAGLLHDLDFEKYPEEHCTKTAQIMRERGFDETLVHAVVSHGWGLCADVEPQHMMEKILYATDELTGLIGAATKMRPSKSVSDIEAKSVMKKYKTPAFAAGCSREVIANGAQMLGWSLEELVERTILAMRSMIGELEI